MNKNENAPSSRTPDLDDPITGEYPVLLDAVADESPTAEVRVESAQLRAALTPQPAPADDAAVSGWLAHVEGEIARLQARWQQVEEQFNAKDALVGALREDLRARDRAVADLEAQLTDTRRTVGTLETEIAGQREQIGALKTDIDNRRAALAAREDELAAAASAREHAQREAANARAEIARLGAELAREQSGTTAAKARNDELVATQAALNLRVQELESYIDGRAQSWSALKKEIAEHKATILTLEKSIKGHELAIEDACRQKRGLASTIAELERRNAELGGRRKEREAAYEELQRKLAAELAANEQLKTEIAERVAEHDALLARATEDRHRVASLAELVEQRTTAIATLEADLATHRSLVTELTGARDALTSRAAELERALAEQTNLARTLREDLAANAERLRTLESTLLARDTELAQARQHAEQQARAAATLSTELESKQASLSVLHRSMERLSHLGASVTELEKRFEAGTATHARAPAAPTLVPAPAAEAPAEELLPFESFMAGDAATEDSGERRRLATGARQLIGRVGGESVTYRIAKSDLTIGRGKSSDIRIPSHFISRTHARITTRGIATTIEDVGSKNGIFVNHERITRRVLRDGDVVTLGNEIELRFLDARH